MYTDLSEEEMTTRHDQIYSNDDWTWPVPLKKTQSHPGGGWTKWCRCSARAGTVFQNPSGEWLQQQCDVRTKVVKKANGKFDIFKAANHSHVIKFDGLVPGIKKYGLSTHVKGFLKRRVFDPQVRRLLDKDLHAKFKNEPKLRDYALASTQGPNTSYKGDKEAIRRFLTKLKKQYVEKHGVQSNLGEVSSWCENRKMSKESMVAWIKEAVADGKDWDDDGFLEELPPADAEDEDPDEVFYRIASQYLPQAQSVLEEFITAVTGSCAGKRNQNCPVARRGGHMPLFQKTKLTTAQDLERFKTRVLDYEIDIEDEDNPSMIVVISCIDALFAPVYNALFVGRYDKDFQGEGFIDTSYRISEKDL